MSLGAEIDLCPREDEPLAARLFAAGRAPQLKARLPSPEIDTRLLEVSRVDRVVDVTQRIAIAEPYGQPMRDKKGGQSSLPSSLHALLFQPSLFQQTFELDL